MTQFRLRFVVLVVTGWAFVASAQQQTKTNATGALGLVTLANGQSLKKGYWVATKSLQSLDIEAPRLLGYQNSQYEWNRFAAIFALGLTDRVQLTALLPYDVAHGGGKGWGAVIGDGAQPDTFDVSGMGKLRLSVQRRIFGGPTELSTMSIEVFQDLNTGRAETEALVGNNSRAIGINWSVCRWTLNTRFRDPGGEPSNNEISLGIGYQGKAFWTLEPALEFLSTFYLGQRAAPDTSLSIVMGGHRLLPQGFQLLVGARLEVDQIGENHFPIGGVVALSYSPFRAGRTP